MIKFLYKVTLVPIPIGMPRKQNIITMANHRIVKAIVYGAIRDRAFDIVMLSSFLLLQICKNPIRITKYVNNGVNPFTALSAALKTDMANSGVKELCINLGTIIGAIIAHFVDATGTRKVEIRVRKKVTNTNTIPVNSNSLIPFIRKDTINTPKLVCLNIKQNWAEKKININREDTSFKQQFIPSTKSWLLLMVFTLNPYTSPANIRRALKINTEP